MANKSPVNWSGIGSAVSAGAGAIGSLFGLFTQNKANKDNIRFQRQENERNRNFQREMADYAYQKNLEQWNRENEYNSPVETRKRLKNAGLNPDLFYGGGAGNMVSADSPMMSAPSGTGGVSPAVRPIGADTHALDLEMRRAQIDNIKADTRGKEANADILSSDASFRDAWNQGLLKLQNADISLKGSQKELTDTESKKLRVEMRKIEREIFYYDDMSENLKAQTRESNSRAVLNEIDSYLRTPFAMAEIAKMASETSLNYAKAREITTLLLYRAANIQASTRELNSSAALHDADLQIRDEDYRIRQIEGDRLELEFDLDKDFRSWERTAGLYSNAFSTAAVLGRQIGDRLSGETDYYYRSRESSKKRKHLVTKDASN